MSITHTIVLTDEQLISLRIALIGLITLNGTKDMEKNIYRSFVETLNIVHNKIKES